MNTHEFKAAGHVLVDGYNVLHAVLLKAERRERIPTEASNMAPPLVWWSPVHQQRVVFWAEALCKSLGSVDTSDIENETSGVPARVTVVFDASRDGTDVLPVTSELVGVVFAPNADDWIVDVCRREVATVVTADRALSNRARHYGAYTVKPWQVSVTCDPPVS